MTGDAPDRGRSARLSPCPATTDRTLTVATPWSTPRHADQKPRVARTGTSGPHPAETGSRDTPRGMRGHLRPPWHRLSGRKVGRGCTLIRVPVTGRQAGSETRVELVRVGLGDQVVLDCAVCGGERAFEQPPCPDGHGLDCPERACTGCGSAVLVGSAPNAHAPAPVHVGQGSALVRETGVREAGVQETGVQETGVRGAATSELIREAWAREMRGRERSVPRIPA